MFAGPNGSGKSTIYQYIAARYRYGVFINADEIEEDLRSDGSIKLRRFALTATSVEIRAALDQSSWAADPRGRAAIDNLRIGRDGAISLKARSYRYEAALIADLVRTLLVRAEQSFSFETVMSHRSKIEFLESASERGYHGYLYFIGTQDPRINEERIKTRVKKGGHGVPAGKIRTRYERSMALLAVAIPLCYRAFIFDNSRRAPASGADPRSLLYLEYKRGKLVRRHQQRLPAWIQKYAII